MIVRPATTEDLPAIARISVANDEPVADPDRPGSRYLEHLLTHATVLVAERESTLVGFAGTIDIPIGWLLTDLFVDPSVQGQGIGRALLAVAFPDDRPRLTFSSSDRRALPIYVRSGLSPWWPLLYLAAPAGGSHPERAGLGVEAIPASDAAALELDLTAADRRRDWTFWAARPDHVPIRVVDRGVPVAVGLMTPPRLGRLVLGAAADPVATVLAVATASPTGPTSGLAIPGPHPATRALLERRWRVEGQDAPYGKRAGPARSDPPAPGRKPGLTARHGASRRRPPPASRSARRSGCPTRSTTRRSCGPGRSQGARGGRTTSGSTVLRSGNRPPRPCRG